MIPVNEPLIGETEERYVKECLTTGWLSSSGPFIEKFESEWATICGRKYGIAVCNGTVALQLAVRSLGLPPGSEIIMPSFTIISCALAAIYNDCVPVFVDCDPRTYTMKPSEVEVRITEKTAAIMPVHIYGHPAEMDPIMELARKNSLAVVEDAAEAHGAAYQTESGWQPCGSFGDVSIFSFYANKLVTTGEGGMIVTDDPQLAERARSLRNLSFSPTRRFLHDELGFNFRMTNVQAALGLAQAERFPEIVARKQRNARRYLELLDGIPGLLLPVERPWARSVYWMFAILLEGEAGVDSNHLATALQKAGVETRPFFVGLHEQPPLIDRQEIVIGPCPVTERISRRGLYLPSGLGLSDAEIVAVSEAVRSLFGS